MNRIRTTNAASRSHLRRAFTLIELLLVLVILGVLAAVVVPKLTGRTEDAKIKAARSSIAGIKAALDVFEVDNGRFPSSDEGLRVLVDRPNDLDNWHGPYVDRQQIAGDPWGNVFQYRFPGQHNPDGYDLYSFGPDGREGNDDITNWVQQK
jgi:general secretion pathway protein G